MYPNNSASSLQVLNMCMQTKSWVVRCSAAYLMESSIATGYLQRSSSFGFKPQNEEEAGEYENNESEKQI